MAIHSMQEVAPYAVNFGIVAALVVAMARKPTRKFLYQRHERMKDAVEAATIAHNKALARIDLARASVQKIASEEASLLERERKHAEQEGAEILLKSKQEIHRIGQETDRLASAEQEESSDRVKNEFLKAVVHEAEENLKRGLKRDDHTAILKRAQNSIEVGV